MIESSFSKGRKRALVNRLGCVALICGCGVAGGALAQAYPERPVRMLVSFGAGGATDIIARLVAQRLSESMQQQVIVDNRPSAGGIVAAQIVAKAEPNGYTVLVLGTGHSVSVSLMKSLPYDVVRDFAPVSTLGFFAFALLVNANSPIRSVPGLIAFAKKTDPGKFSFGTTTVGGTHHVSTELFKSMAGLETLVIPFKTGPALIAALRGNETQAIFEFIAPALPHIRSGAVRALGVTSGRRFAELPDVPTLDEAGLPGYEASAWVGIAAPVKTPKAIVDRLNRELNAVIAMPEVKQRLQDLGIDARGSTREGFRDLLAADIAKWKMVIEQAKIERQ
ncbi:MAG: Bug family tripartite tricarboxylate transporter substrate binding protein [Methyloceanibacter sp.]